MADETSQMAVERENLAIVIVEQPPKTADPQFYEGTMFGLPREWTAEIRPRKASSKYSGKVDQFFYEPGTRRQFRSLKAAKRHLGLDVQQNSHKRKSKASKNDDEKDKFESSSKVAEEDKSEESDQYFDKISTRVRRQLINGDENSWDTCIKVPDAVQQRWRDTFLQPNYNNQKSNAQGMK